MTEERRMEEIIRNQTPVTLPAATPAHEACRTMLERRIGAILVTDEQGGLAGIFTGRDAVRFIAETRNLHTTPLDQVMTRDPETLPPGRTAIEALRIMRDGGFRHIPIMDNGKLVGVVSRGDFRGLERDRLDVETGYWETMR